MKALKAKLITLKDNNRGVEFKPSEGIYNNGDDNAYSEKLEIYKNSSVTGLSVSTLMAQYVLGRGFGDFDDAIFNKNKNLTARDIAEQAAEDITDYRGFWVHIKYNANLKATAFRVLNFHSCRLGLADSDGYIGKVFYCDDWQNKKAARIEYDMFNNNKDVLKKQIENAGGIEKYKGQILFFSMQKRLLYPIGRLHAAQNDADTEAEISNYKNIILHSGFLGKLVVTTPPLTGEGDGNDIGILDDSIEDILSDEIEDLDAVKTRAKSIQNQKTEEEDFKRTLESFGGIEGQSSILHVQLKFAGDDISKAIKFDEIKTNVNPDFFEKIENTAKDNIAAAYNNCPQVLIKSPDAAFFSGSGEQIKQAKLMYQDNTEREREFLERSINFLWSLHKDFDNSHKYINPLINLENGDKTTN